MFKKTIVVFVVVLLLVCFPVTAFAESDNSYQVSSSLLLTPIINTAGRNDIPFMPTRFEYFPGDVYGIPSTSATLGSDGKYYYGTRPSRPDDPYWGSSKLLDNTTNAYWVGTNSSGAFTFGNFWINNDYRYSPEDSISKARFSFLVGSSGYNSGDVVRFKSTVNFQYRGLYSCLDVYLVPYFKDGYGDTKWNIYSSKELTSKADTFEVTGTMPTLSYVDPDSRERKFSDSCDGIILVVEYDYGKTNGVTADAMWLQFSYDSEFAIMTQGDVAISEKMDAFTAEQMKTNDLLGDLNANQELTNDKLDDLLGQPEQEKEQASQEGNSNVGAVTDVIPDHSSGFINGMSKLADSLSYSGTKCEWTVPQLYIPALSGVSSEKIPLTDGELKVDLGSWVQKLPSKILSVVRVLLTIALIVYCVKELYDTIQYALTLRSGGS